MIRLRSHRLGRRAVLMATALGVVAARDASAQWTYVNLHPTGATESRAIATTDTQQAGWARLDGAQHAGVWSATATSFLDLHPPCATSSFAHATTGTEQAGYAFFGSLQVASLWSGTAPSWVNLNPAGATASYVLAMSGAEQGGWAVVGGVRAPGIWGGTAASWIDLSPVDNIEGLVRDTVGTQQVGYSSAGAFRASLWTGTADSWVDLSPTGSAGSIAYATIGTEQAGAAIVGGVLEAGTWAGTPESWVSIHPTGAGESQVLGMTDTPSGSVQTGYATYAEAVCPSSERALNPHAGVWSGTAASWVDLHDVLSADYACSETRYVFSAGGVLYVAGFAYNSTTARDEAILWINSATTTSTIFTSTTTSITLTTGENPIPMTVLVSKPGRVAKFVLRGAFPLPDPDTDNPTAESGVLNIVGTAGSATYALDAVGWTEIASGFKFRNPPCVAIVRDDLMKVSCKPDTGTLALPESGPVNVTLNVGGICYCAMCGGTPRGIPSRVFRRTDCAMPAACP